MKEAAIIYISKIPEELPDSTLQAILSQCGKIVKWNRQRSSADDTSSATSTNSGTTTAGDSTNDSSSSSSSSSPSWASFAFCEFDQFTAVKAALKFMEKMPIAGGEICIKVEPKLLDCIKLDDERKRSKWRMENVEEAAGKTDEQIDEILAKELDDIAVSTYYTCDIIN